MGTHVEYTSLGDIKRKWWKKITMEFFVTVSKDFTFIRRFYPKQVTVHSGYTFFCQYMCSLGIKPTTFALLTQCSNHWATGTWYTINNSAVINIIILFIYLFLHLCIWHKLLSKVNYIAFKHFVSSCIFWESNPWPWYCYHHVLYCLSTRKKNCTFS